MSSKAAQIFIEFGAFRYEGSSGRLLRQGQPVALTPKAFEALGLLLERPGELVPRDAFVGALWPDTVVEDGNLTSTIWMIRRALGESAQWVQTVPKRGYRFSGPVGAVPSMPLTGSTEDTRGSAAVPAAGESLVPPPLMPVSPRRLGGLGWAGAVAALVIAVLGSRGLPGHWLPTSAAPMASRALAVLPLANLSGDASQSFIAEGLTESLITELTQNPALSVTARTSSMLVDEPTVAATARTLGVDLLVRGAVVRAADHLRVTLQIVDGRTGRNLWANGFDGDLADVIDLDKRIAVAVAAAVRVSSSPSLAPRRAAISPRAQEAYLLGRELYYRGINEPYPLRQTLLERSVASYRAALVTQPDWAQPYAGIAQASHWMAEVDPDRLFTAARAAALQAIALDDSVAEGHGALAYTSAAYFHDPVLAEREFTRAVALDPGTRYRHGFGMLLTALGRFDDAEKMFAEALRRDPLAAALQMNAAISLFRARRFDRARVAFEALSRQQPDRFDLERAAALGYVGRTDEALAILRGRPSTHAPMAVAATTVCVLTAAHRDDEARAVLAGAANRRDWSSELEAARAEACLGHAAAAVAALDRASAAHGVWLADVNVLPDFDRVRGDVGIRAFLARQGLAAPWHPTSGATE